MKCINICICTLFISITSIAQPLQKVEKGTIIRIENLNSAYIGTRNIDIWLPEDYSSKHKYAVLYMQDGQMMFDPTTTWNKKSWEIDKRISHLKNENKIKDVIVVGIWNGDKKRHAEYFPQKPFDELKEDEKKYVNEAIRNSTTSVFNGFTIISDNYLKFIVEELKPIIDKKFNTKRDRDNTFIGGSSMGGLISIYAICEYPKIFGGAMCMSTHWPGIFAIENNPFPNAFINYLNNKLPDPKKHKIYFDCGDKTLDALYPPIQMKVDALMKSKKYSEKNWLSKYFQGQDHSEGSWNSRVEIPLLFLLQK
jgi:predicted alpha/beta superfamily hydrolase